MDDILVYGRNQDEHDHRLTVVLEHLKVTLNEEKCNFLTNSVRFLGQRVDSSGIHPDPYKVELMKCPISQPYISSYYT